MNNKRIKQKAPILSGNANNEANAGFGYVNSNNEASDTNTNVGARLYNVKMNLKKLFYPCPLAKKQVSMKGVSRFAESAFLTLQTV